MSRRSSPEVLAELAAVSVAERIEHKLVYLQRLLDGDADPPGTWSKFPRSLTAYARLHNPSLRLYRVASPNDFSTESVDHGVKVAQIQEALGKINDKYPKKPPTPKATKVGEKLAVSRGKELEAEAQIDDILKQMHRAEHELDQERIATAGLRLQLSISRDALAQERLYGSRNPKTKLRLVK